MAYARGAARSLPNARAKKSNPALSYIRGGAWAPCRGASVREAEAEAPEQRGKQVNKYEGRRLYGEACPYQGGADPA